MKTKILIVYCISSLLTSCKYDDYALTSRPNQIMLLYVDYASNLFEGGVELQFTETTTAFTVRTEYLPAADFGSIKLFYSELNQLLFHGELSQNTKAKILFPEESMTIANFEQTVHTDYVTPENGFQNLITYPNLEIPNYSTAWAVAQSVIKTREYLEHNPKQKVLLLLYTPKNELKDSKWIFILKN